jgi:plasmid maintenance system antidote protein VapI
MRTTEANIFAIPPGEYLAEEIEARDMALTALAKRMGRPLNAINEQKVDNRQHRSAA